jgi:hypothetical protein
MSNEVAIISYSEIDRMAEAVTKSGLFGIKTKEQAIALMLIAQAEGLHPAIAARDYHIVQGRPTLKADAMLARFQTAGGSVSWETLNDTEVTAVFSHPKGGSARITWSMDMAKKAGLTGKDVWKQYPRQMLRSRVVSEGIRTVFPGVAVGIYTPEEAVNFDGPKAVEAAPESRTPSSRTQKVRDILEAEAPPPVVGIAEESEGTPEKRVISLDEATRLKNRIDAIFTEKGYTPSMRKSATAVLTEKFGIEKIRDLTEDQAKDFEAELEAL